MTESQAKQIREFRLQGIGYKAIASRVGLSRDAVRNYCKNHALRGYAVEVTMNIQEQIQQGLVCRCCGKVIQQPATGRKKKFCSETCRREWWGAHPEATQQGETVFNEKPCVYCGQPFIIYGSKTRRYCSHDCYVHDRFYRNEEYREPYVSQIHRKEASQ